MFAMLVSSAWVTSVVTVSFFSSSCLDSMMALDNEAQVVCGWKKWLRLCASEVSSVKTSLCFKYPHNAELLRGSDYVSKSVRNWWCSNGGRSRGIMWMDGPGWDFGSDGIKWQHTILVHW